MRVPASKVYRAFPELDRFSDRECEEFVRLARRGHVLNQVGRAGLGVGALIGVLLLWIVIGRVLGQAFRPSNFGAFSDVVALGYLLAGPLCAILAPLIVRDVFLRRAIARQIDDTRCPACSYSMLGLRVVDGAQQCPECGRVRKLSETNLTPAHLMIGTPP